MEPINAVKFYCIKETNLAAYMEPTPHKFNE